MFGASGLGVGSYRGYIGVIKGLHWDYIGMMEKNMESTTRAWLSLGFPGVKLYINDCGALSFPGRTCHLGQLSSLHGGLGFRHLGIRGLGRVLGFRGLGSGLIVNTRRQCLVM